MLKEGISFFPIEIFLSHSAEKFRGEYLNVSENFGYRKFPCRRGVASRFFRLFFSQDRNEELRRGSLLCFRESLVSKILYMRGGKEYHDFPSQYIS